MDTLAALIAVLAPALPDWGVAVASPAGVVAADTPPEQFPPSVIVEQTNAADALANPTVTAQYRLRFMAPSGVAGMAAYETARALGRDPLTGLRRPGRAVTGFGFLRSLVIGGASGPVYDPDLGTPTIMATAVAVWHDTGG